MSFGGTNEVVITVRARTSVREGFDTARKEAELAGTDAGADYTRRFADTVALRLREKIQAPLARVGQEMGENLGEATARGMAQVVARGIAQIPQAVDEQTDAAGEQIGNDLGDSSGRTFIERLRQHFQRLPGVSRQDTENAGDEIGETLGTRIRDRVQTRLREITTRVRSGGITNDGGDDDSSRDRDRRSLQDWIRAGFESAQGWVQGFGDRVSTFFSGDIVSLIVKALAVGALATALGPVIGAALTTAILGAVGGGVLAVGIAAAFKDPRIQGAANDLKTKLGKIFEKFGEPFRGPVANFLEDLSGLIDRLAPKFQKLAESFAPIADQLGEGFIDMLENAMPGILEAAEASKPLFETLAKHAPEIGKAISDFFSIIAEQGDDANRFFDDLLAFIEALIPFIAGLIAVFTSAYNYISDFVHGSIELFRDLKDEIGDAWDDAKTYVLRFTLYAISKLGTLLEAASTALSWIPGIGPKLKAAEKKFESFRKEVNDELSRIKDKTVTIRMRVMGLAAANAAISVGETLKNMGYAHGGIRGMASGGLGGGLTLVGERGPELAEIAPGGRVWSNADTRRMMAGGGGEFEAVARWETTGDALLDAIASSLRIYVKNKGNGSVQAAFGQGRS